MSKIPTELTEKQFAEHIEPYLSKAERGFVCTIPLYRVFNYILYWLHTGCQYRPFTNHDQYRETPDTSQIASVVSFLQLAFQLLDSLVRKGYSKHGMPPCALVVS